MLSGSRPLLRKADVPAPAKRPATAAAAGDAAGASFETLGQGAVRTRDIGTLLSPFVERCDEREARHRPRALPGDHRVPAPTLPQRTFAFTTDEPGVVAVSDYDAGGEGLPRRARRLRRLQQAGHHRQGQGAALRHAEGPRQGRRLADEGGLALAQHVRVRQPRRRQALGSTPSGRSCAPSSCSSRRSSATSGRSAPTAAWRSSWSGARVYNRCTGDVLVSKPPSTGDRPNARRPATRTRPARPAERGRAKRSPRRRPRATICRPS